MNQKLEGQIRHIISIVAGFLAALGILETELLDSGQAILVEIIAVVFALVAFIRSYVTKQDDSDAEIIAEKTAEKLLPKLQK